MYLNTEETPAWTRSLGQVFWQSALVPPGKRLLYAPVLPEGFQRFSVLHRKRLAVLDIRGIVH
jgi:hypothetical protein